MSEDRDKRDWRELYEAAAKEGDPDKLEALVKEINEAIEAEEYEKKLSVTAVRRTYIVKKRRPEGEGAGGRAG